MMECRPGCAACCIVLSISSPLPGMPEGKPAGVTCVNLDRQTLRCTVWGTEAYPDVCKNFSAKEEHCGQTRAEAVRLLGYYEEATKPDQQD